MSRRTGNTLGAAVTLASVPTLAANAYLATLTIAAALRRRVDRRRPPGTGEPRHRFAVLVPAHDEEPVIGPTVESIVDQRYPPELFTVHVVADNCTDKTAEIARINGAEVHERVDPVAPGKGPALGWLVERVEASGWAPDAFVVLDADTTMAPDFLRAVDAAMADGGSAWQGYYAVRDPDLSPAVALRYAAIALRHYVRPLGRTALGGSCGLYGNGMVLRREVLRDRPFSAHLTEDAELELELLREGLRVGFVPEAVVEAEMPMTLASSRTQHERWEAGRQDLARRYVPSLLRAAVLPGTPHRAARADAAADLLLPPLSVLAAGTGAVAVGALAARALGGRGGRSGLTPASLSAAGLALHVVGGLRLAEVPGSVYASLVHTPRLVLWKLRLWSRVLARPGSVSWTRTARNEPASAGESAEVKRR